VQLETLPLTPNSGSIATRFHHDTYSRPEPIWVEEAFVALQLCLLKNAEKNLG